MPSFTRGAHTQRSSTSPFVYEWASVWFQIYWPPFSHCWKWPVNQHSCLFFLVPEYPSMFSINYKFDMVIFLYKKEERLSRKMKIPATTWTGLDPSISMVLSILIKCGTPFVTPSHTKVVTIFLISLFRWRYRIKAMFHPTRLALAALHRSIVFFFFLYILIRPCAFFLCFSSPARVAFGWKQKKKNEDYKIRAVDRRCQAHNTSTLHLQTRLSGHRNFFTVIAMRKKNFLLIRSWMEVDGRVNVSNHYSKSMMLAIHAHFPKLWKHQTPSCEN